MASTTPPGGSRRDDATSRSRLLNLDAHRHPSHISDFDRDFPSTTNAQLGEVIPHPAAAAVAFIMRRAAESNAGFREVLKSAGSVVIFEVPGADWVEPVAEAWSQLVHADRELLERAGKDPKQHPPPVTWGVVRRTGLVRADRASEGSAQVRQAVATGMSVCGIAPDPTRYLPSDLLRSADIWVTIPPLDNDAIAEAAFAASSERASIQVGGDVARLVALDDLLLARRPHQSANAYIERLATLTRLKHPAPRLTLDDVFGMEEAVTWGWSLARDLADFKNGHLPWSAVDRGLLLGGPAGTGKTTFAVALAASCQVPLVLGSLAQWQAAGHLGDLLKAMRTAFQQARQSSPCILFVDEIDAFGDRSAFGGDHQSYSVQVVNALLEELDGASGREGVVVIGACNNPGMLDPALRRSGRLDRVIAVGHPNRAALEAILRQHLAPDLPGADLSSVAALGLGATGADAARWARCAKRRARQDGGRSVGMEDILAEVRGDETPVPKHIKRRIALHEAGHALVAALHRPGSVLAATIRVNPRADAGVLFTSTGFMATREDFEQQLIQLLAGRAAEETGLSEAGCGAGGGPESDLAKATMLAVAMSTAFGLGREDADNNPRLLWLGRPTEQNLVALLTTRPDIAQEAATALNSAYQKALDIIDVHRAELQRIVKLLLEQETLNGSAVEDIVREAAASRNARKPRSSYGRRPGTPPVGS